MSDQFQHVMVLTSIIIGQLNVSMSAWFSAARVDERPPQIFTSAAPNRVWRRYCTAGTATLR
jgi:hypothetical protein